MSDPRWDAQIDLNQEMLSNWNKQIEIDEQLLRSLQQTRVILFFLVGAVVALSIVMALR